MAQILIVDDDIRLARGVEGFLRGKGHRTVICTDGLKALDAIGKNPPDLILLDVTMPGISGLEMCQRARKTYERFPMPILILSARGAAEDRIAGLESGADDYLPKPFELRELELRIEALLRRYKSVRKAENSEDLEVGGLKLDTALYKAYVKDREVQLTPVEYELLRYLMQRAGRVVSAEQLLQEVWRYYPGTGDTAVVRVQIMNLRDKIELDRRHPVYIQTVYRHGYLIANRPS